MAVFLTQNSPGLRTSPVKRGYWVVQRVLGESDSAAAAGRARTAARRGEARPAAARDAGAASGEPGVRLVPRAVRFVRPGVRRLRPDRRDAHEGSGAAARSIPTRDFPGGSQGAGFEGVQHLHPRASPEGFVDNLSRKLLAYRLGRSLLLSDEPLIERMRSQADGERLPVHSAGRPDRDQSAVPATNERLDSRGNRMKVNKMPNDESSLANRISPPHGSARRRRHDGAAVAGIAAGVRRHRTPGPRSRNGSRVLFMGNGSERGPLVRQGLGRRR